MFKLFLSTSLVIFITGCGIVNNQKTLTLKTLNKQDLKISANSLGKSLQELSSYTVDIKKEQLKLSNQLSKIEEKDRRFQHNNINNKAKIDKTIDKLQEHESIIINLMNDILTISEAQRYIIRKLNEAEEKEEERENIILATNKKYNKVTKKIISKNKIIKKAKKKIKLRLIPPVTMELIRTSDIMDKPSFKSSTSKVWEINERFTTYQKKGDWYKLSGEFINGRWKKIHQELWIHKDNIIHFKPKLKR